MNFDKKRNPQCLRGASKPEVSKEELVKNLHKQRTERELRRRQESAAEKIQAIWRGRVTRIGESQSRLKEWGSLYIPVVSKTEEQISALALFSEVCFLSNSLMSDLDEVLPSVLYAVIPPYSLSLQRVMLDKGSLTELQLGNTAAVRGALALVLRSLSDSEENYTGLYLDVGLRDEWLKQCFRVMVLCCGIVGSPQLVADELLQAAAIRTITHLTNIANWKSFPTDLQDKIPAQDFLTQISQKPMLFSALCRLLNSNLEDKIKQNHVELMLRAVVYVLDSILESSASDWTALFPFIRSIFTISHLQNKLTVFIQPQRFTALKEKLLVRLKLLFLALEEIPDLPNVSRLIALRNLTSLAAGHYSERLLSNGQKLNVLISNEAIGTHIPLEVYLTKTLSILQRCLQSGHRSSEDWQQEIRNPLVFAEQAHLLHLLSLFKRQNEKNLNFLAGLYLTLIHHLAPQDYSISLPYCNVVAFASGFFPVVWKWIARDLNIPAESFADQKESWTLKNLKTGLQWMTPGQIAVLGLFCRCYSHLLLVLDDEDFYRKQYPLNIEQNRALTAFLNNLAYFTYCKESSTSSLNPDGHSWRPTVEEYFPQLLRQLYERNNRTVFCPEALWLSPFHDDENISKEKMPFTSPAVIQAFLNRTNRQVEFSGGSSQQIMGLCNLLFTAPQCIPFTHRVEVFRSLIQLDKQKNRFHLPHGEGGPSPVRVKIRRNHLLADSVRELSDLGEKLKGRLFVTFIDAFNIEEPGIDQGGLMIELIEEIVKAGFHPNTGLFQMNEEGYLYTSLIAEKLPQARQLLFFLGQMLGKALYEGLLMDVPLAPFFLLRVLEQTLSFDDLASLDHDIHHSLIQVKRYDGDASDLGLDFSVEADIHGKKITEELIPGGSNVPVTNENKLQYVHLMADWHINKRVGQIVQPFSSGLARIIPIVWLRLFNPKELNALLNGGEGLDIDLEDLKKHTSYKNGYSEHSFVVRSFWKVVYGMKPEEKAALLKFVTSCSRPPLGGFKHLQPPFTIWKVDSPASPWAYLGGQDVETLPTASTCINMLKLPNYRRSTSMKKKLILAVTSNSGFGFS